MHNCYYEKIGNNAPVKLEDLPFDIPDNWTWIRQKNICWLDNGTKTKGNKLPYLEAKVIRGQSDPIYLDEGVIVNPSHRVILVDGENSGEIMTPPFKGYMGSTFKIFSAISQFNYNYLLCIFSLNKDKYKNSKTGVAIPHLNKNLFKESYIAVPPFIEQERIFNRIDQIESLLFNYENIEEKLSVLEQEFPEKLKKSILQYAIEGKIVKQNPNDEPASILLERIKAEKEKLIKEGKIKRDKNESYIYQGDDKNYYEKVGVNSSKIDVPFVAVETANWVRLSTICTKLVDGNHNPPKGEIFKTDYLMLSSQNINNDSVVEFDKCRYLAKKQFDIENERTNINASDILFTSVGTLGRSCVYNGPLNICFQRSVSVIKTLINPYYLKMFFDTPKYQNMVIKEATGTAQKGFYLNQLSSSLILVYSLEYQSKLVYLVDKLLNIIQ